MNAAPASVTQFRVHARLADGAIAGYLVSAESWQDAIEMVSNDIVVQQKQLLPRAVLVLIPGGRP